MSKTFLRRVSGSGRAKISRRIARLRREERAAGRQRWGRYE